MYCPSCDKSYGAVHSRCPECHSWLKVSAPANSRAKIAKAASSVGAGNVSTLDKEPVSPVSWTEPPTSGGDWGKGVSDSWSDALPAPTAPSFPIDPAPVSDAWGGGGGAAWGGTSSSDSWGATEPPPAKMPTPTAAPVAPPLTLAPSPVAPALGGGAWLSGTEGEDDGWGGSSSSSFAAPAAPAIPATNGLSSSDDGWGGSASLGAAPPVAAKTPASAITPDVDSDGWGGASSSSSTFGGSKNVASKGLPAPSQGWLGGDAAAAVEDESATGWLGDSRTTKVGVAAVESDGWLGGEDTAKAKGPSMTEMVDRAIGVEEADDFVDDSWVDEEVGNGEFDDLESPEYVPPTPEVGGAFLKMLLVAVLVLFVGGGVMFMGQEKKTPEQIKAEEKAKELEFARSSIETGKNYLKDGKGLLAIGPFEAAMTSLKTAGGTEQEILDTKVQLARAFMKAQEYQKAYDHWSALAKGPQSYRAEAKSQMVETSKLLRSQAMDQLAEAAGYIKNGEYTSVVDLGQSALKIFEQHQGTNTQKGKAHGVIGRGYINGREYGKAKDALKRAMALNPAGNYGVDLARIANETAEVNYYGGGGGYSRSNPAPSRPKVVRVEAKIGNEPSYQTGRSVGGGARRRTSNNASTPPSVSSAPAPTKTRAIPAYQRPAQGGRSTGGRKGDKNVVPGYR